MHSVVHTKTDSELVSPSRQRILRTAKTLFATRGYEQATTSAIARIAATSETQLMKYFGSKQGILEAIFTAGWTEILGEARKETEMVSTPNEKLTAVLRTLMTVMERDPELKLLMLLEGRRIRKEGPFLMLTATFLSFVQMLDEILIEMQTLGMLRLDLNIQAVRSAVMGMIEGMLRDSFLAHRAGYPAHYSGKDMTNIFSLVLNSFGGDANLRKQES